MTRRPRSQRVTQRRAPGDIRGQTQWSGDVTGHGRRSGLSLTVRSRCPSPRHRTIADEAGNALTDTAPTGANDPTFVLDNTAPTVEIVAGPVSQEGTFTATITFERGR